MTDSNGDFRLGAILVEPDRLRVSRGEQLVVVQPRVMDVLVALASAGGAVTSRQALEAQVWAGAHVGYHALARAVYEARKALEDVSPGCDLVETIPRRGYRLKAAPVPVLSDGVRAAEQTPPGDGLKRRFLVAAVALVILGLFMHGIGLHGTSVHYFSAALVLGATVLRPSFFRRWRSPAT